MAQVGRISGPLLQENLLRNGNNLSFKNLESSGDLLYIDVSTGRIGVDTNTPRRELEISNTLQSSNLIATTSATVPYYSFENSTITAINNGDINLNGAEGVFFGAMSNSTLLFNTNNISTITLNENIDITPYQFQLEGVLYDSNTYVWLERFDATVFNIARHRIHVFYKGSEIYNSGQSNGDGSVSSGQTFSGSDGFTYRVGTQQSSLGQHPDVDNADQYWSVERVDFEISNPNISVNITNDLNVFGNIHTPGDITLEGNIIFGNESEDTIDINAEVTSDIIPDQNDTYNLGTRDKRWSDLYTNLINGRAVSTDSLEGGLINFNTRHENVLYVSTNGNDDNVGDSPLGPYKTIKRALEAADASTGGFTTIYVYPGGYEEETPLVVPANVSIVGQDIRNTIITPTIGTRYNDVFLLNGESTVQNITIKDTKYSSYLDSGYGFKFAENTVVSSRSPYIQNISFITSGTKKQNISYTGISAVQELVTTENYVLATGSTFTEYPIFDHSGTQIKTLPDSLFNVFSSTSSLSVAKHARNDIVLVSQTNTAVDRHHIIDLSTNNILHTVSHPDNKPWRRVCDISENYLVISSDYDSTGNTSTVSYLHVYSWDDSSAPTWLYEVETNTFSGYDYDMPVVISDDYLVYRYENSSTLIDVRVYNNPTGLLLHTFTEYRFPDKYGNSYAIDGDYLYVVGDQQNSNGFKLYKYNLITGNLDASNSTIGSNFSSRQRITTDPEGEGLQPIIVKDEFIYIRYNLFYDEDDDPGIMIVRANDLELVEKNIVHEPITDSIYGHSFCVTTNHNIFIKNGSDISFVTPTAVNLSSDDTDPRGFSSGDAGKGALVDGASVDSASQEASMLFHNCTFITPGVDAITMTNGVRVEWLNSFTYFADKGLYAVDGVTGHLSTDGSTVKYGAEIRSIGSANVYGNYGAVADGSDTLMYLIQHNFAYIGTGKDSSNDNTLVQQEQETLELNSGKIYFQSTDQLGNFRVGNEFNINLETGETSLDISSISADALSGLIISGEDSRTIITGEKVETGNVRFTDNSAASLVEDLNLTSADEINLLTNTSILGNLDIRDNLSFGGTLNLAGDQPTDTVSFNVEFEQNFNPNTTLSFDLGSNSKFWKNSYLSKFNAGQIQSYDNILTTDESNSNLELRASGTGKILIPNNNVDITNNLQVNDTTTLRNSVINYEYGPELIINGTFDSNLNGWSQAGGGSASAIGGNLQINATGSARNVSQEITVIPGSTYDFSATFKSVSNSNQFYLRIFESGQGTLFEWNETSGLINDQVLTVSFTPEGTAINIIFRAVNTVVEWDNVSVIEDIGLVETIIPIDVNITGTLTQIGNSNISNNYTQTGNTNVNGLVDINSKTTFTEYEIDNNVLRNISTGLYLNRDDPYNVYGLYEIVRDMAVNGATEADYPNQPEKNLITFLANGTSAPDYAFSYVDVNRSGSTTSSDALTWLQYIANGTTGNSESDAFLDEVTQKLLDQEFSNPGKFNSPTHNQIVIVGDYGDPDLDLRASGTGKISFPTNDLRITNNLFVNYAETNNLNVLDSLSITQLFTKDSPINIGDNYVRSISSNADLELRAEKDVRLLSSTRLGQNLEVGTNTSIRSLSTTGNIAQSGLKLQTGDYSIIGNITVSSLSTNSEIQFDNILFDDNFIETTESNSDLLLISNGSGVINIPINDVRISNDLTLSDLYSSDVIAVDLVEFNQFIASDNITIFDNVITTTNSNSNLELRTIADKSIRLKDLFFNTSNIQTSLLDINISADNLIIDAAGALKLPSGTTSQRIVNNHSIRFNSTDNIFEAYNSTGKIISFGGVYSSNRRTNVLTDDADSINLTVNLQKVGNVDSLGLNIHAIQTDDVRLDTNVLRTTVSNSDLDLQANGTGKLILDNISITGNTIENNYNGPISLKATGYGVYKLGSTSAVVIPYGNTIDQPSSPEIGTSRWNTDDEVLEVWDGSTFISAAGISATISEEEFQDLILEYTLVFG